MDYTDLNEITDTLIAIIQNEMIVNLWPLSVKALPGLLRNDNTGIGVYLFHVLENAHYKNYPAPGQDQPPVSFTPMPLNLFYQLSANIRDVNDEEDAIQEQRLMSVAMKALHDHPQVMQTMVFPPNPAFQPKDINIKITLQNLTPAESVQYWAAADSPVRLSAYYEVSVVFMQPEIPRSYAGRVLSYGNYIFVQGAPQITASQNTIEFPSPVDSTTMQVKIQPAQAPPAIVTPPPINSIVSFFGTSFNAGALQLLLISPLWTEPAVADAAWNVTLVSENQVDAVVQPTAVLRDSLTPVDILPGLYAAQINISKKVTLSNGTIKTFNHSSNQFPFSVMPRVDTITLLSPGEFRIKCYLFQHGTDIKKDDLQVYTAETKLDFVTGGALIAGQYKITLSDTIELKAPATVHGPNTPLRIMIRGIESEPKWINVP